MRTVEFRRLLDDGIALRVQFDLEHGDVEKTEMRVRDFNEGLTVAMFDLMNNWNEYRRRYQEWLKQK